jgi:hypothetical protein
MRTRGSRTAQEIAVPTSRQLLHLVFAGVAVGAACARTERAPDAESAAAGAPPPGVEILAPAEGDSVTLPFTVQLGAVGVEVVPATGQAEPGKGHHHLVIDADAPTDTVPLPSPPSAIHLGSGVSEYRVDSLAPGEHRIIAIFASGDHVPMRDVRRDTVRFVVRGGAPPAK